jgi:hypothetical protein
VCHTGQTRASVCAATKLSSDPLTTLSMRYQFFFFTVVGSTDLALYAVDVGVWVCVCVGVGVS